MSYSKQTQASGLVGLVVLGLAGWLIVRIVAAGGFENFFVPGKAEENALVAELANYPGNEQLFADLEASFPDEYEKFTETLAQAARAPGPDDRVLVAGSQWIARFFAAHSGDFVGAPIAQLDRVVELEQKFFEDLQDHDVYACAAYAKGEPLDTKLPERFDVAGGEMVAARFAAIRAGRTDQQLRFAATPEDFGALITTLRANGLNDEQIDFALGTADPSEIGAPLACETQVELLKGIRAQDEHRRALLIADYAGGA